jgi:hypothetical protein
MDVTKTKGSPMEARVRPLVFGQDFNLPEGQFDLQEVVRQMHAAGLKYAKSKALLERLELTRSSVKARLMQKILQTAGDGKISETRLLHQAEATPEYWSHLEQIAKAREDFEIHRIVYESLRALFDAKRSEMSYAKAEMNLF